MGLAYDDDDHRSAEFQKRKEAQKRKNDSLIDLGDENDHAKDADAGERDQNPANTTFTSNKGGTTDTADQAGVKWSEIEKKKNAMPLMRLCHFAGFKNIPGGTGAVVARKYLLRRRLVYQAMATHYPREITDDDVNQQHLLSGEEFQKLVDEKFPAIDGDDDFDTSDDFVSGFIPWKREEVTALTGPVENPFEEVLNETLNSKDLSMDRNVTGAVPRYPPTSPVTPAELGSVVAEMKAMQVQLEALRAENIRLKTEGAKSENVEPSSKGKPRVNPDPPQEEVREGLSIVPPTSVPPKGSRVRISDDPPRILQDSPRVTIASSKDKMAGRGVKIGPPTASSTDESSGGSSLEDETEVDEFLRRPENGALAQILRNAQEGWVALFPQGTRAHTLLKSVVRVSDADTLDPQGRLVQREPTAKDLSMLRSLLSEVKSFSGEATGPSEFIDWAEEFHGQLDTCSNTRRVMALKMKLRGTAKKLWLGLSSRTRWSYRESMVELCRHYIIDAEEDEPESDFWARKQKNKETAAAFLSALRILVDRIPKISRPDKDRMLRIQFRQGLDSKWDRAIHTAFRTKTPDPIELVQTITRLEQDDRDGNRVSISSSEEEDDEDDEVEPVRATKGRKKKKKKQSGMVYAAQETGNQQSPKNPQKLAQKAAQQPAQGQSQQGPPPQQMQPQGQQPPQWYGQQYLQNFPQQQGQNWQNQQRNWNPPSNWNGNRGPRNWNPGPRNSNQGYGRGRMQNQNQSQDDANKCRTCGEEGHWARECPLWKQFLAEQKKQESTMRQQQGTGLSSGSGAPSQQ